MRTHHLQFNFTYRIAVRPLEIDKIDVHSKSISMRSAALLQFRYTRPQPSYIHTRASWSSDHQLCAFNYLCKSSCYVFHAHFNRRRWASLVHVTRCNAHTTIQLVNRFDARALARIRDYQKHNRESLQKITTKLCKPSKSPVSAGGSANIW